MFIHSFLYCFCYSKREVNKKVLKVPGIEQKVKLFFFFFIYFLLIWVFKTLIDSYPVNV